jgi:hypothetical protein
MISSEPIESKVPSTPLPAHPLVVDKNLFEFTSGFGSRPGRQTLVMSAIKHPSIVGPDHVSDALALLLADSLGRRTANEDLTPTFHTQASDSSEEVFCSAVDNAFEAFGSQNVSTRDAAFKSPGRHSGRRV